jgi:hypothetical protein
MTDAELYQLIQSDQQALSAYEASNDDACAARCSEIAPPITQEVAANRLRMLLAQRGRLAAIRRVSDNTASPEPPYDACATLMTLLYAGDAIDMSDPAVSQASAVLVDSNLLDADDVTAITALAYVAQTITQQQVGAAREWHRVAGGAENGVT